MRQPIEEIRQQFLKDIAGHQLSVESDEGVNRRIHFRRPDTSLCWFDLVTIPETLSIFGDVGNYVFRGLTDMFEFFRQQRTSNDTPLGIHRDYWSEKLICVDEGGYYENKLDDFTYSYSWCCFAIVWGIQQYDLFKAGSLPVTWLTTDKGLNLSATSLEPVKFIDDPKDRRWTLISRGIGAQWETKASAISPSVSSVPFLTNGQWYWQEVNHG